MHHHELFIARISLERQRAFIGIADRKRSLRASRARRAPHARRQIASWLIRWAHRLDPETARAHRTPHATA